MATRTYNIELLPDGETLAHWLRMLSEARDMYNECIRIIDSEKVQFSLKAVHEAVYERLRSMFPSVPAQGVIRVYKDAISALRSRRSNKHNGALPNKKNLSMRLDKRLYGKLTADGITLSGVTPKNRILVPFRMYDRALEMFGNYMPSDPLIYVRDGHMLLSVPFEVPEKPVTGDTCVGVDVGERRLFVTSEGKSFTDRHYNGRRRKVRFLKRELKTKKTKSARRHLRKLSSKERNMSDDMCRRAAKALVASTKADIIVMERLKDIKKKTSRTKSGFKRKAHNRRFSQVPLAKFQEFVRQKAQTVGKAVETVSPAYTSQTDSRTGKRDGVRRNRRYVCKDGTVLDSDWNAAVNIALKSKHPVSSCWTPVDGGLQSLSGQGAVSRPIACKPRKRGQSRRCRPCKPTTSVVGS